MADIPDYLKNEHMTGAGVSEDILDRAFWRKEHELDDEWVAALDKADRGVKQPLLDLLRSECDLPTQGPLLLGRPD